MASSSSHGSVYSKCKRDFIAPKCDYNPPLESKLHVSKSTRNPRKAYWRCDFCKFFDWIGPNNMVWTGAGDPDFGGRVDDGGLVQIQHDLAALKEKVGDIVVSIRDLIKFGVLG